MWLCLSLSPAALAVSPSEPVTQIIGGAGNKVVRVGYPIQEGLSTKTEDGQYVGYNVDYLNELVKYTNWRIEFVEVPGDINTQLGTLGDMLEDGRIDMLGSMNFLEALQEIYLYPSYSYGSSYTALTVAESSSFWQSTDFRDWNGIRVATCPALARRMEQLEDYANSCGFTYKTVEFADLKEVTRAVLSGNADACLQVDINIPDGLRVIARFNPKPYYFALNKERSDLLLELNAAMLQLMEAYPSLQSELYSRYFLHKGTFQLSEDDLHYIASLPTLRVLYFTGNSPIQDVSDERATGVAADFMQMLTRATGLKTTPVFANSYEEGADLIESGAVDLIAAMPSTTNLVREYRIRLSAPIFQSSTIWVTRDSSAEHPTTRQISKASVEREMNAIKMEQQTASLLDAYCVSFYMRKAAIYNKLQVDWTSQAPIFYCTGMLSSVEDRLANIISGFANSLSEQTRQQLLYENSRAPVQYTFGERLEVYRTQILLCFAALLFLLLVRTRIVNARLHAENSAEVDRLYQFSKMLNERIIQYDVRQDRLIMQNHRMVFTNTPVLQPFLRGGSAVQTRTENERRYVERLREMLRNHIESSEFEFYQNGVAFCYNINLIYVDENYAIGRITDVDEEVRQRSLLEHRASHDALTGLMNRSAIQNEIDNRLKEDQQGVFLLMDLDNFKKVNDTLGHGQGDKVLQRFASLLEDFFWEDDLKARLGGDEFVVFLTNSIPEKDLTAQLGRLLKVLTDKLFNEYSANGLSVSIGACYVQGTCTTFAQLYKQADSAMYAAKFGGKNACFISDGSVCSRASCQGCQDACRRRDYLIAHGVTDPKTWREHHAVSTDTQ